ncbi:MAG: TylF/MycF/NovP-related O-methyltransferase [bacterium]|nr:TylF/MycF/NovP-related O-methyltransferase [bacterium]
MAKNLPGSIVECGVFKGVSLIRWAGFRELFANHNKNIVAFDVFGDFPRTNFAGDKKLREKLIADAGKSSISKDQMMEVLNHKRDGKNVECIKGDIIKTIPKYLEKHPDLKISLLNLDTDIYEPAVTILENFWPRIVKNGVLILDDYGVFPGETKAVDDYFKYRPVKIRKFNFSATPCYIVKK